MKTEEKYVGPEMAEKFLATSDKNRAVSTGRVLTLANEMRLGKWVLNGENIIFSESGKLLDGQHRLLAIIESGCHVQLSITTGAPDTAFETINTGRSRSHGDIGGMAEIVKPALSMAAGAMIWRLYHHTSIGEVCPPVLALRVVERFPAIQKWANFLSIQARSPVPPASFLTALVYLEDVASKPQMAERFFAGIDKGADLETGSPILALRNRMMNMRADGQIMNAPTCWAAVARTLTAVEAHEELFKLARESSSGRIRRPSLWQEHAANLPKAKRLDDMYPQESAGKTTRENMRAKVQELRGQAKGVG